MSSLKKDEKHCEIRHGSVFGKSTVYKKPFLTDEPLKSLHEKSAKIENHLENGNIFELRFADITSTPQIAFYKDGKALDALNPDWQKPTRYYYVEEEDF